MLAHCVNPSIIDAGVLILYKDINWSDPLGLNIYIMYFMCSWFSVGDHILICKDDKKPGGGELNVTPESQPYLRTLESD